MELLVFYVIRLKCSRNMGNIFYTQYNLFQNIFTMDMYVIQIKSFLQNKEKFHLNLTGYL